MLLVLRLNSLGIYLQAAVFILTISTVFCCNFIYQLRVLKSSSEERASFYANIQKQLNDEQTECEQLRERLRAAQVRIFACIYFVFLINCNADT